MLIYYLIGAGAFLIPFLFSFLLKGKSEKTLNRMKYLYSALMLVFFVYRYLSGSFLIASTVGLNQYSPFGPKGGLTALLCVIVIWFVFTGGLILVTYAHFYKDVQILPTVVKFFLLPVYVLAFATIPQVAVAMDGAAALESFVLRGGAYAVEIGLALGYVFTVWRFDKHIHGVYLLPKAAVTFLAMFVVTLPEFALQAIFGQVKNQPSPLDFSVTHRILVYGAFVLPVLLHLCLRKFKYEQRRFMLLNIALGTMISYCARYTFQSFIDVRSWPLHLCNTAMFIVPLCLLFRWEKLYYFTFFINVLGALFAILMPNYSSSLNLISTPVVEFWINHYCAFFMPLLCMSLGIFRRPKFREFVYSMVTFTVYYLAMLFVNAWYVTTDFFFTNSDFITDKLGDWAEALRSPKTVELAGHVLTFYPAYQIIFYLAYVLLALATWFVYEQFFEMSDLYSEIRGRREKIKVDALALKVALGGRSVKEPVNMDGVNKLILKNFSKRYSTSDVYAVKDANLEVEGGQIFGFLGPNGAGKSTIIKSIVGIQTITSGAIEICGYDCEKQSVESKMQIGFVPDHYALYENLTGREYVNYIADLYGVSEEDRTRRINEYVERFHLQGAFDNQMKTYSHGMKQKITIMSALVHEPKLWILDEPLTGLDPESIFQVKECMKAHAAKGNIVFFSSHIIDVVERICDKIAIIKKGNILCTKTVAEIEESGTSLEDFYMTTIGEKNA